MLRKVAHGLRAWAKPTPEERRRRILKWSSFEQSRRLYFFLAPVDVGIFVVVVMAAYARDGAAFALLVALVAAPILALSLWLSVRVTRSTFRNQRDFSLELYALDAADSDSRWRWTKSRIVLVIYYSALWALGTAWLSAWANYLGGPIAAVVVVALSVAYTVYLVRKWRRRRRSG